MRYLWWQIRSVPSISDTLWLGNLRNRLLVGLFNIQVSTELTVVFCTNIHNSTQSLSNQYSNEYQAECSIFYSRKLYTKQNTGLSDQYSSEYRANCSIMYSRYETDYWSIWPIYSSEYETDCSSLYSVNICDWLRWLTLEHNENSTWSSQCIASSVNGFRKKENYNIRDFHSCQS